MWRHLHAIDADLPMIRNPRAFARQHVDQFLLRRRRRPRPRGGVAASAARIAKPSRRALKPAPIVVTTQGASPCRVSCSPCSSLLVAAAAACGGADAGASGAAADVAAVSVTTIRRRAADHAIHPRQRHVDRAGRAEVAAEVAGRVVATPVERGSRVAANAS